MRWSGASGRKMEAEKWGTGKSFCHPLSAAKNRGFSFSAQDKNKSCLRGKFSAEISALCKWRAFLTVHTTAFYRPWWAGELLLHATGRGHARWITYQSGHSFRRAPDLVPAISRDLHLPHPCPYPMQQGREQRCPPSPMECLCLKRRWLQP
jgi:hypothetical protein